MTIMRPLLFALLLGISHSCWTQLPLPPGGPSPIWNIPPNTNFSSCKPATYASCLAYNLNAVCPGTSQNCTLKYSTQYYAQTNGHFHEGAGALYGSHPASLLQLNSGAPSGSVTVTLSDCSQNSVYIIPSGVGQYENLSIYDSSSGSNASYDYLVGWTDFIEIPGNNQLIQIGGNTTNHGGNSYNHHMNPGAAQSFLSAVDDYFASVPAQTAICINDMSLPVGGVFDIQNSSGHAWEPPHHDHSMGGAADVAAAGSGGCPTADQLSNPNELVNACLQEGATVGATSYETARNHVHCEWRNYQP